MFLFFVVLIQIPQILYFQKIYIKKKPFKNKIIHNINYLFFFFCLAVFLIFCFGSETLSLLSISLKHMQINDSY